MGLLLFSHKRYLDRICEAIRRILAKICRHPFPPPPFFFQDDISMTFLRVEDVFMLRALRQCGRGQGPEKKRCYRCPIVQALKTDFFQKLVAFARFGNTPPLLAFISKAR